MFSVGIIINTHGIKGEVKVKRITDFVERFAIGETVYLTDESNKLIPLIIDGFRTHKNNDLLHFKNYNSIEDVETFKGKELKIKEEQLTELTEHEFYFHEIIGCKVETISGEEIGVIESILTPGANDVWVVKGKDGKEYLIPYIEQVVKKVDVVEKKVFIELMEGLLS